MAVRRIDTELALTGEKQFNDQMKAVNSNLKTLKSDMALVTSEFTGQANSADALRVKHKVLTEEYAQQAEKVKALEKMLDRAKDAYGENSSQVDKYRQQLNYAKVQLNKFGGELDDTSKYLKEAEDSADGCAKSIDAFGKQVKDADRDVDGFGDSVDEIGGKLKNADGSWDLKSLTGTLGELKGALMGGAVVTGVTALYGAIRDVVEETKEYREIMGKLETSSAAANYSPEQTEEAFRRLYGVLGDTQTAATTLANLQATGLGSAYLMTMIDAVTGAWIQYNDSIPIDGLSEAINETIQTRKVTGVLADVLNWAGESEDEFNAKLAGAKDTMTAANIVLNMMNTQHLPENARQWRQDNEDLVAYNEAQADLNAAMGELGKKLQPLVTRFTQFKSDMIRQLTPIVDWIGKVIGKIDELGSKKITVEPKKRTTTIEGDYIDPDEGVVIPRGSHAGGMSYVPYDGYVATLHRGERVLTAGQAAVSGQGGGDVPQLIEIRATVELDGDKVGEAVTRHQLARERAGRQ